MCIILGAKYFDSQCQKLKTDKRKTKQHTTGKQQKQNNKCNCIIT